MPRKRGPYSPRQPRTRGDTVYRLSDWKLADRDWLDIAKSYDGGLAACFLAKIAQDAQSVSLGHFTSSFEKKKADETFRHASLAYTDAVRKLQVAKVKVLATGDMTRDAITAVRFRDSITKLANTYITAQRRSADAFSVTDAEQFLRRLGQAAASFVAAYENPMSPANKSAVRSDIEAMLCDFAKGRIESKMPPDLASAEPMSTPLVRLTDVVSACRRIASYAREEAGELLGDPALGRTAPRAWFIQKIKELCKSEGLPDGAASEGEARFIHLIILLHRALPRETSEAAGITQNSTPESVAKMVQRDLKKVKSLKD